MMPSDLLLLGKPLSRWAFAVGSGVVAVGAILSARHLLKVRLEAAAARTATILDDLLVEVLKSTRPGCVFSAGILVAAWTLQPAEEVKPILVTLAWLTFYGQAALWATRVAHFLEQHEIRKRREQEAAGSAILAAAGFTARLVLWAIFLLLALDRLGVNVTGLVAGLGIGGLAVALAVQNVLGDVFASISILLDRPFVIGDFLIVGEVVGAVEHIGLKTTRIRSLSGEQVVLANGDLLKSRIHNFKRMTERRVVFGFGLTYRTPRTVLAGLGQVLRRIIEAQAGARFDRSHFKEFGESALVFETVYFLNDPDFNTYMDVQQAINLALLEYLDEHGVAMAYPTRTLILEPAAATPMGTPKTGPAGPPA